MIFVNYLPYAVRINGRECPSEPLPMRERSEVVDGVRFVVYQAELPPTRTGVYLIVPPSLVFQYPYRKDLVVPDSMGVRVIEQSGEKRFCLELGSLALRALPSQDKRVYYGSLELQGALAGTPNVERILSELLRRNRRDQAVLHSATGQRIVLRIDPNDLSVAELIAYDDDRAAFPFSWERHSYAEYGALMSLCRSLFRYVQELYVDFEPISSEENY